MNNVLAAKGKTTADGMTANGNTAMAAKYTVSERELLNKDAVSGAEVTNQLDDIVYADDTVYLSRSDWSVMDNNGLEYATGVAKGVSNVGNISGDVPTYVISDDLRAKFELKGFAASLNPTDPTDAALYPGKEAYTYGAKNNLKLIDMVGLDYTTRSGICCWTNSSSPRCISCSTSPAGALWRWNPLASPRRMSMTRRTALRTS